MKKNPKENDVMKNNQAQIGDLAGASQTIQKLGQNSIKSYIIGKLE